MNAIRTHSPHRAFFFLSWFTYSYFATVPDESSDPELLKLGTDKSLFDDAGFLPFAQKYKDDQDAFFEAYKKVSYYTTTLLCCTS